MVTVGVGQGSYKAVETPNYSYRRPGGPLEFFTTGDPRFLVKWVIDWVN